VSGGFAGQSRPLAARSIGPSERVPARGPTTRRRFPARCGGGTSRAPSRPVVAHAQGGDVFGALASRNARPGAGSTSAGRVATTLGGNVRTVV